MDKHDRSRVRGNGRGGSSCPTNGKAPVPHVQEEDEDRQGSFEWSGRVRNFILRRRQGVTTAWLNGQMANVPATSIAKWWQMAVPCANEAKQVQAAARGARYRR